MVRSHHTRLPHIQFAFAMPNEAKHEITLVMIARAGIGRQTLRLARCRARIANR
jgi:hypothetical protein